MSRIIVYIGRPSIPPFKLNYIKNYHDNSFRIVNDIYTAICDCQVLHPDEQEQLEDEMAGILYTSYVSARTWLFAMLFDCQF